MKSESFRDKERGNDDVRLGNALSLSKKAFSSLFLPVEVSFSGLSGLNESAIPLLSLDFELPAIRVGVC